MSLAPLLSLLLAAAAVDAPVSEVRPAPSRPGLSWAEADALAVKLKAIEKHHKGRGPRPSSGPLRVTESEVNSYVNLSLAEKLPKGLSELEVHLLQDRLAARGMVDLEELGGRLPSTGGFSPFSFLTGKVPLELRGRLENKDGFGTIEVEEVRLATIPLPMSMLEQIVVNATKDEDRPEGFDIHAPFRLPYSVKRVRFEPAQAWLEF